MTSVAVMPPEIPTQYALAYGTAEGIARDVSPAPVTHYYGSPSGVKYVPNTATNLDDVNDTVSSAAGPDEAQYAPRISDRYGRPGTTQSIVPTTSIRSIVDTGGLAPRVYSPQTGFLGTSQTQWTQKNLYPTYVTPSAGQYSNLGPPSELLSADARAWALHTAPPQIARQPQPVYASQTPLSYSGQHHRSSIPVPQAVAAPSRSTTGPASPTSTNRVRGDNKLSSSYTRSSSDGKEAVPFERKAQELRERNEMHRANRSLMYSAHSYASDSAISPTFPSDASTKSLSSKNWELRRKLMPMTRSGPTPMPPHIQSRNPGFRAHPVSPLSLFYYDESAPNDVLLAHDVRGIEPSRGTRKFIKRILTCAGGRAVRYRVPGEGYSEVLPSNLSMSSIESHMWRSRVAQPRSRGIFGQACYSGPADDTVGRLPTTTFSRLSNRESTYGDSQRNSTSSSSSSSTSSSSCSSSGTLSVYTDSSGTLSSSSFNSQLAMPQSRFALAAAPAPYTEIPSRRRLASVSVAPIKGVIGYIAGSPVVGPQAGSTTPPAWALVATDRNYVSKSSQQPSSTQEAVAPRLLGSDGTVVEPALPTTSVTYSPGSQPTRASGVAQQPQRHEPIVIVASPFNAHGPDHVTSITSSGRANNPEGYYHYDQRPLAGSQPQNMKVMALSDVAPHSMPLKAPTHSAVGLPSDRRQSLTSSSDSSRNRVDGLENTHDPMSGPGTMRVRCPTCNGKGYYVVAPRPAGSVRSKTPTVAAARWCNCCEGGSVAGTQKSSIAPPSSDSSAVNSVVASVPRRTSAPSASAITAPSASSAHNQQPRRKQWCGGCWGAESESPVTKQVSAASTANFLQHEAVGATTGSTSTSEQSSSAISRSSSNISSYTSSTTSSDESSTSLTETSRSAATSIIRYKPPSKPERERDLGYTVRKMYCEVEELMREDQSTSTTASSVTSDSTSLELGMGAAVPSAALNESRDDTTAGQQHDGGNPFGMCPTFSVSYRHYPKLCYDVITPTNYADFFRARVPPLLRS